jgi:polar amino acid transport system substrate-binding protein
VTTPRLARRSVAVAALTLLTACSAAPADASREEPAVAVDEQLRALLPQEVREAGVLTVATDAAYPPASSFGPDGRTVVGLEPDLMAGMGALLGVRVEFRLSDFDAMLDDLTAHRVDLVMSAMTDTAERQAQADFVDYFRAGTSIVVQRGNPHGVHDLSGLCGEAVAVEAGTVQVGLLERSQERCDDDPILVQTHATNDDALVELRTGRVAAVLTDYPPAVFVTTDERTQRAFQLVSDVQYEPGLYGIAVPRDRAGLRDALAGALERLVDSGAYAETLETWEVTSGAVSEVTVNGGAPTTPGAP